MIALVIPAKSQRADFPFADFKKADSVAAMFPKFSLKDVRLLADTLTSPFNTDVEKFRSIFKWVTNNIAYDVDLYMKDQAKQREYRRDPKKLRKWNATFSKLMISRLKSQYKTVCSGYSELVEELCMHAGISCKVIIGYGRTSMQAGDVADSNHAWNAVKLDDKWYLCDATWSAGFGDIDARKFQRNFTEAYFLSSPDYFIRRHYPSDTAWSLLLKKPTREEFAKFPLFYRTSNVLQLNSVSPQQMNVDLRKGGVFRFTFTTNHPAPIEKAYFSIDDGKDKKHVESVLKFDEAGEYSMECMFDKKGTYQVTVYLNWSPCLAYTVRVK